MTTRIYIVLTCVVLFAVSTYTSLSKQKNTVIISSPSLSVYEELQARESSLSCACSRISIPYENFTTLMQPSFHQICYSSFIDQTWISLVYDSSVKRHSVPRAILSEHFRSLSAICARVKEILADTQLNFQSTRLISVTLLSRAELNEQMNSTLTAIRKQAPNTFKRTLSFMLDMLLASQVMSMLETNWKWELRLNTYVSMVSQSYGNVKSLLAKCGAIKEMNRKKE